MGRKGWGGWGSAGRPGTEGVMEADKLPFILHIIIVTWCGALTLCQVLCKMP